MKQKGRFLIPLNSSKIKKKGVYGFDVETIRKADNKFLMGSIVGEDFKYVSWDKDNFRKNLLSKKFKNKSIFATNLMFDFCATFSIDEILNTDMFYYLMHNKSSNFVFIKYLPYNITFLDTMNFFPASVKTLGEKLNLEKLEYPEILNQIESIKDIIHPEQIKQIEEYNIRDSEITYKWINWLQNVSNIMGANMRYTLASTSMDLFKRKYLKSIIRQPPKKILSEMYNAYYGGRTETIVRGYDKKNYNYYDINACYPSVMRKPLPDLNTLKITQKGNMNLIDLYEGISKVKLKIPYLSIPYLPYREGDKLLFPYGEISGWYNHFELRKALDLNYEILDIKDTIYFTDVENYLKDYTEDMFNNRIEDFINELIYKLFGNSIYGKFAQRLDMEKTQIFKLDEFDFDNEENKKLLRTGKIFLNDLFLYISKQNNFYASFILPIISLYITSYARDLLYDSFIKNNENNVLYFDTDSCITSKEITVNKELGGIKKEHDIRELILVKPKQYYLRNNKDEEIIRFKGVPLKKLNRETFINILSEKEYNYTRLVKFKEALKRNLEYKDENNITKDLIINSEINVNKKFNLNDNKRLWFGDFNLNNFEISEPIKI